MKKAYKIIYWVSTLWLSLGMVSTASVQLLRKKEETDFIIEIGYPVYFLTIIGIWKILGVIAILVPKTPLVKEWAYAGFFFMMSGAIFSHLGAGNSVSEVFPALLLLALTVVSWYFRPLERRLIPNHVDAVNQ